MKNNLFKTGILTFIFLLPALAGQSAEFKTDNNIVISSEVNDNLYAAAGSVSVNAIIRGDLHAAGGKVTVNDTVVGDVMAAGSDVLLNASVLGDATLFGENINILHNIQGDLIVFGGMIEVGMNVVIDGDLIVFGGYLVMNGLVQGNVIVKGGNIVLNGTVNGKFDVQCEELKINGELNGPSELAVTDGIEFGEDAIISDDVRYWSGEGEVDFAPYLVSATATFDPGLQIAGSDINWKALGISTVFIGIIYTLSVLLVIMLLVLICGKTFENAGSGIADSYIRNFGYGVLYFIGLPLLAGFFIITLIGIPVGVFLLTIFGFSILFAGSVSAVTIANWIRFTYKKNWSKWMVILIAALVFPVLKLIMLIPFAGGLIVMVIAAIVFGTLFNQLVLKRKN